MGETSTATSTDHHFAEWSDQHLLLPDAKYLCADPGASYRDDVMDDFEFVRTDGGDSEYDLGPLDDDADDAAYRHWMVESQRKNNSLMKRIL